MSWKWKYKDNFQKTAVEFKVVPLCQVICTTSWLQLISCLPPKSLKMQWMSKRSTSELPVYAYVTIIFFFSVFEKYSSPIRNKCGTKSTVAVLRVLQFIYLMAFEFSAAHPETLPNVLFSVHFINTNTTKMLEQATTTFNASFITFFIP
jgi:hypothetical protein